ncbi:MAG: hypothetical protein AAGE93_18285 [Bacteroidota bacterium]
MQTHELHQEYLRLTNKVLPQMASEQCLPIRFNHCFQRVILDTLFQDCWYNHLDRNSKLPAYRQLSEDQLKQAIAIAQSMIDSSQTGNQLNWQSLVYREKSNHSKITSNV